MDRWGQLAYTSARGGFGIHAEADLKAPERDTLVAGAYAGRGSFGQELPLLADPAQVATFHRNLAYRPVPGIGCCFWHSAPAGADESGRTGNCFIHALLVSVSSSSTGASSRQFRPVELWRSPAFLAPYGVHAVRSAALPPLPPSPGDAVTRTRAAEFLSSFEVDRLSVFARLVEAVAERRRQPVIFGVSSPEEGALWLAGLSYLLSPGAAWGLSFSVWEAPELLTAERLPELEVICAQESAIPPALDSLGLLVLRSTESVPPVTSPGTDLPSLFAQLAVHLFSLDPATTAALLGQIDEVSAAVHEHDGHRVWPVAIVMAQHLEQWPHLQDTITGVLLQVTPASMGQDHELWRLTERLVRERKSRPGVDLDGMVEDVRHAAPGPLQTMMHQEYVERAAQDPAWYSDPEHRQATVDPPPRLSGDQDSAWFRQAVEVVQGKDTPRVARTLTWLVDFLLAQGWPARDEDQVDAGEDHRLGGPLRDWCSAVIPTSADARGGSWPRDEGGSRAVDQLPPEDSPLHDLADVLMDPALSQEYLRNIGHLSDVTRRSFLRHVVTSRLDRPGATPSTELGKRVSPALVDFIVPHEETSTGTCYPELGQPLVTEALVQRLDGEHGNAVASSLAHALRSAPPETDDAIITELLDRLKDHDLPSRDMVPLLMRFRARVDEQMLCRTLATAEVGELDTLADDIADALGPSLRGLARELVTMVKDPVTYCWNAPRGSRIGGINEAVVHGLSKLTQLHRMLNRSGPDQLVAPLSPAWAPSFDLLVALSDPRDWHARRQELFGPGVPTQPSVDYLDARLIRPTHGSSRTKALNDRLLFNAWFADAWPEEVSGQQPGRTSSIQPPWQSCAERYLRSLSEEQQEILLDSLLDRVEKRDFNTAPFPPSAKARRAGRELDAHLRSAEEWFSRAAGTGGWRGVGAKLGLRRRR